MSIHNHKGTDKPTNETTVGNDGVVAYDIHIRLSGTKANIAADWATLAAINFAATSAVATWNRAS
jgi:2-methylcitrate dehydratase PrpD